MKNKRGQFGIFLSLLSMLFVIGLIVMIFAIMSAELKDSNSVSQAYTSDSTLQVLNITDAGVSLTDCASALVGSATVTSVVNSTTGETVESANYTVSTCTITLASALDNTYNNSDWNVTYTFTYAGQSYEVINDTVNGISGTTDWFDIFLVIGAMIVLILLTVIIITAIRGSGMVSTA